jgi:hypothetical protein
MVLCAAFFGFYAGSIFDFRHFKKSAFDQLTLFGFHHLELGRTCPVRTGLEIEGPHRVAAVSENTQSECSGNRFISEVDSERRPGEQFEFTAVDAVFDSDTTPLAEFDHSGGVVERDQVVEVSGDLTGTIGEIARDNAGSWKLAVDDGKIDIFKPGFFLLMR